MSRSIISKTTVPVQSIKINSPHLSVSEMFSETLQGEGIFIGQPATFLRLQGCHIGCSFCDSAQIWKSGHTFLISELLDKMSEFKVVQRLFEGEHLVITGGAPLLQEDRLLFLLDEFVERFEFVPYIEIENECTIDPSQRLINYISCWNNSPKLSNSHVEFHKRFKPRAIKSVSSLDNSWFKFVISKEEEWKEIEQFFLMPRLIKKEQIILMPKGWNQFELNETRLFVAEFAMQKNVRFSDRLQITLYDSRVGV